MIRQLKYLKAGFKEAWGIAHLHERQHYSGTDQEQHVSTRIILEGF